MFIKGMNEFDLMRSPSQRSIDPNNFFSGDGLLNDTSQDNKYKYIGSPRSVNNFEAMASPLIPDMDWEMKSNPDADDLLKLDGIHNMSLSRHDSK